MTKVTVARGRPEPAVQAALAALREVVHQRLALRFPATTVEAKLFDYGTRLVAAIDVALLAGRNIELVHRTELVPATWWQHFKAEWFPAWACRRWPIREREIPVEVEIRRVCPHLPLPRRGVKGAPARRHVDYLTGPNQ